MATVSDSTTSKFSAEFLASVNAPTKKAGETSMELSQDRFLKLLTTQLKNQDPLNPMDNAQMTSQMAQISTVNGIEKLNATLQKLTSNSTDSQVMQASAMLGREILVEGSALGITRTDGKISGGMGGYELADPADTAKLHITDANGMRIRSIDLGDQKAGMHEFAWDGLTDSGAEAASGSYQFAIEATRGSDKVTATPLQGALVTGIVRDASGVGLQIANLSGKLDSISVAAVKQIY